MARRADLLCDVSLVRRGNGIFMAKDLVLAVAIGARRRIDIALGERGRVDAFLKLVCNLVMATSAGLRLLQFIRPRVGHEGAIHLMRAVAVDTVGRLDVSFPQRLSVYAFFERADELATPQSVTRHAVVFHVAGRAGGGFGQFGFDGFSFAVAPNDELPMA